MTRLFASLKAWFNPLDARGGFVIPHLLLIAVVVGSFALGVGVGRNTSYNGAYFAHRYSVSHEIAPPQPGKAPVRVTTVSVPLSAENKLLLPSVTDQGTVGACAAESSTYYDASYEWRRNHPGSWLRFSPRATYDHYSDFYNGGADGGSWPDQDLEASASAGVPRFNQLPYGPGATALGLAQFAVDNPIPYWAVPLATQHRFTTTFNHLSGYQQGAGPGLVGDAENAIANGKLVMIATPVPPPFDAASTNPYIDFATQDNSRGFHEITFFGYKIDPAAPGGAWFHFRNSWTKYYGINGDAWYSARDVANFAFGAETLALS